jgi:hypothetical protein
MHDRVRRIAAWTALAAGSAVLIAIASMPREEPPPTRDVVVPSRTVAAGAGDPDADARILGGTPPVQEPGQVGVQTPAPPTTPNDGRIAVQVVGPGGPVAGVQVSIGCRFPGNEMDGELDVLTGADGIGRCRPTVGRGMDGAEYFATVISPLAEKVRVPVTVSPPPTAPVVVRLASVGTVVVHLVDEKGAAWTGPAMVVLEAVPQGTAACGSSWLNASNGTATFPAVGLGLTLEARVSIRMPPTPDGRPGPARVTRRERFVGPKAGLRPFAVDVPIGAPQPRAVGRLVNTAGVAIPARSLCARLLGVATDRYGRAPQANANADANGRFVVEMDADLPAAGGVLVLSAWKAMDQEILRRAWTSADPSPLDLGDVVDPTVGADPPKAPVLVSGRIVAPAGVDPRRGWFRVCTWQADRWSPGDVAVQVGADGSFTFRGTAPPGARLALMGGVEGCVTDGVAEFLPGATGVEVRLSAAGTITGSVVLPKGTQAVSTVWVTVKCDEPGGGHSSADALWLDSTFWTRDLRPGTVDVVVGAAGENEPLVTVTGVQVVAGQRTADPRLARIDLTKLLRTVAIRVVDANGAPSAGAEVWTRPVVPPGPSDVGWSKTLTDANGVAQRVVARTPLDVVATAPGMVPADARGVAADTTLRLSRAQPSEITVRLAPWAAAPPGLKVSARLVWCGSAERPLPGDFECGIDPRTTPGLGWPIAPGAPAKFDVTAPGRWRAMVHVTQDRASGGRGQVLRVRRSTEVVVTETPQRLEIVADVDPAEYAAVCDRLSK